MKSSPSDPVNAKADSFLNSLPEVQRKYVEMLGHRRIADRYERGYDALGQLMGILAGTSAVIAALSVQLLGPRTPLVTGLGFLMALASFIAASIGTVQGIHRAEDLIAKPDLPEYDDQNIQLFERFAKIEESGRNLLRAFFRGRLRVAFGVVVAMCASLILLAAGQLQ